MSNRNASPASAGGGFSAQIEGEMPVLTTPRGDNLESGMKKEACYERNRENCIEKYRLDNGLTVILEENHSSPVVAVNVWVKTGSACENEGEYGLAHVHEHMLFKGTTKRDVGEIAKVIESSGGDINAFTSFDETVYYVVIASRFLDTALDVLADAIQNSTFNPQELKKELEVVLEEIRRGKDSPGRNLSEKMFRVAFEKHPYGRSVIGSVDSVRSFSRQSVTDFYKKWYSPNNIVLIVVGDFNAEKIKPKIDELYGGFPSKKLPECVIENEPEQREMRAFIIDKPIQECYFSIAYHIPNATGEDTPALDVLSYVLGGSESSRLYRNIKEEKGLVNSIYAYSYTPKHEGIFVIGGTVDTDKAKEALAEIIKEISRFKYEPVDNDELSRVKVNIETDAIYTKQTMQGQAQKLGFYEVKTGDFRYEDEYLDRVNRTSRDDVILVARKYFNDDNLTAGFLFPSTQITMTEDEIKTVAKASAKEVEIAHRTTKERKTEKLVEKDLMDETILYPDTLSGESAGDYARKHVLDNGITVLIKKNSSVPLFAARAAFLGGVRYETVSTNGLSNFVSEMLTRGTKKRSTEEIARQIESLAGEVEGFSGRNSFGVTVESLSKNFDEAFEIFADVLLNPSFDEDEIKRARREILAEINRQGDNLPSTTVNLFLRALFSKHPYGLNPLGSIETVSKFNENDLKIFYQSHARPEDMVISVVGDVDEDYMLDAVKKQFGSFKRVDKPAPKLNPEVPPSKITKRVENKKDKAQTHIVMGFLAPSLRDDDYYVFELLNTVLSGQGGRLFLELRDRKSLAYTVTSFYTPGLEPGFFGLYIGTAPHKEQEATLGMKEQLASLLKQGITDDELKRAQNYLVGDFEIGLQRNSSQAAKIGFDELYGLGWEEYKKYPEKIYAVTKEDVLRAARKYINLDTYTLAIVKPESLSQ